MGYRHNSLEMSASSKNPLLYFSVDIVIWGFILPGYRRKRKSKNEATRKWICLRQIGRFYWTYVPSFMKLSLILKTTIRNDWKSTRFIFGWIKQAISFQEKQQYVLSSLCLLGYVLDTQRTNFKLKLSEKNGIWTDNEFRRNAPSHRVIFGRGGDDFGVVYGATLSPVKNWKSRNNNMKVKTAAKRIAFNKKELSRINYCQILLGISIFYVKKVVRICVLSENFLQKAKQIP